MQREALLELRWELDGDGGGEAWATVESPGGGSREMHYVFGGLEDRDHLPDLVADLITEDGRDEGSWSPD